MLNKSDECWNEWELYSQTYMSHQIFVLFVTDIDYQLPISPSSI